MILHTFRYFLRQLYRQSTYSTVNLLGLASGMACFILIALYATDELTRKILCEFSGLNFEFLSGSAQTALDQPGDIMITASAAEKYFGTVEALGKELIFLDTIPLTVSDVIRDLPEQTHAPFRMVASQCGDDAH